MSKEFEKFTVAQWGVLMRRDKCLIVRGTGRNEWELPGGRIDEGELITKSTESAFRREIKEELGLDNFDIIDSVGWMVGYTPSNNVPVCRLVYVLKNDSDDIKLSDEHEEYKWINVEEVNNYPFKQLINCPPMENLIKKAFVLAKQ